MHIIHIIVGLISLQSFSYVQSDSEQHGPNDKKLLYVFIECNLLLVIEYGLYRPYLKLHSRL